MSELRYNRLLIPVLVVAVLVGATTNVLLQVTSHSSLSPLSIVFSFLVSLLSGIGVIAIMWSVALRWPKASGVIMLLLGVLVFDGILAYFDGRMSLSYHNPALLALLVTMAVLYAIAGVILLLSKKVIKGGAAS